MMHGMKNLTGTMAALLVLSGGAAHAKTNLLQCQAKQLRCESRFYRCLSRCDRRAAARGNALAGDAQVRADRCDAKCDTVYGREMTHIESVPPCHDVVVTPDPLVCEAMYLNVEATFTTCQARCADRGNSSTCLNGCDTRHGTALDQLNANPVCKDGRASSPMLPGQN